jgi:agmatine deiminase
MPAEFEPHEATWLTWPRCGNISFPCDLETISSYWVAMCRALCPGEKIHINVFDEEHEEIARRHLESARLPVGRGIFLHRFPACEPWCRDHGPIFVVQNRSRSLPRVAAIGWIYNAWGGKYPPWDLDARIPSQVADFLKVPLFEPGIVLEGGSLDTNGRGTLLTTEQCLLNRNRNPRLSRSRIEKYLRDYLGFTNILWLGEGIEGDDTDGHVDDLARFVNPTTVVTTVEKDPQDANYGRLRENLARLRSMKDQDGRPLRVVTLPMPGPVILRGQRYPATYANFYIGNAAILLPIFGHRNDRTAQRTLQELFPKRKVTGVDCRELILGQGAFHCLTQQQPRAPRLRS